MITHFGWDMKRPVIGDRYALIAGSVLNGVAAYLFIAIGTRTFGAGGFAPVSIVWTIWALTVAVVTFPLQHWAIRTVVSSDEADVRSAMTTIAFAVGAFSMVVFVGAFLARSILFGSDGLALPLITALIVIEAGVLGLARGVVSGRGQFTRAAVIVGGENLLRLAAGLFVVAIGWSATAYAGALLAGVAIVLVFPASVRPRGSRRVSDTAVVRELGGIAGGTLVAQIILTGQPLAVSLLGASSVAVTAVFATTAVFRAPYLIALGLALRSMRDLANLARQDPDRLRRITVAVGLGGTVVSLVGGLIGMWVGPLIISLIFGAEAALDSGVTGAIVFGSAMALVSLGLTLVLIAQTATHGISISWILGGIAGLALVVAISDPVVGVSVGFATAETVAVVLLTMFAVRSLEPTP